MRWSQREVLEGGFPLWYLFFYLNGLIIFKRLSIISSCCISSEYRMLHLFSKAVEIIRESKYCKLYRSFNLNALICVDISKLTIFNRESSSNIASSTALVES